MKDKILTEITDFCENCPKHECCPEEECVLFRVEQIVNKKEIYSIEITEILRRYVNIEAESEIEAINIVEEKYKNEEIVLDANDCLEYEIKRCGGNE